MQSTPPPDSKKGPSPTSPPPAKPSVPSADQKIAELGAKVRELEKLADEQKNNYLRACADLENYKKRVVKEREELIVATSERLLRELLDVKDHLELAIDHSKEAADVKALHSGVSLTLKQMGQFLEKFGVTELKAVGETFDPAFHEAVMQEESAAAAPGSVAREFQKGYLYHGRLLRPARVAVAQGPKS